MGGWLLPRRASSRALVILLAAGLGSSEAGLQAATVVVEGRILILVRASRCSNAGVDSLNLIQSIPNRFDPTLVAQATEQPRNRAFDPGRTSTQTRLDASFIDALPIIGHDYQDALKLAPGVTDPDEDGTLNVHGARDTQLQYRLDGTDVTDPVTGNSGMNLSPLVIGEIDVVTAGAPAELGRAMGGFANNELRGQRAQGPPRHLLAESVSQWGWR